MEDKRTWGELKKFYDKNVRSKLIGVEDNQIRFVVKCLENDYDVIDEKTERFDTLTGALLFSDRELKRKKWDFLSIALERIIDGWVCKKHMTTDVTIIII
ncbi:hypothetical protein LCGC14_0195340 [marine sediment metagenome]|uniref:Uncharacterized protein n=1 Tax=marine sediment metagenome TaxID=412755 RepID=A0A0F9X4C7_9ZZZZ